MKSHLFIIATSQNAAQNSIADLERFGATEITTADNGVIEVDIASNMVPMIANMEGICAVRCSMSWCV